MLDALHAYGLGVLLANVTHAPVSLYDKGALYVLTTRARAISEPSKALFERLFPRPTNILLKKGMSRPDKYFLEVAGMDGLMAALITAPGPRMLSIYDLQSRCRLNPTFLSACVLKLHNLHTRLARTWNANLKRKTWWDVLAEDYSESSPKQLVLERKSSRQLTLPLTIDPACAFANHHAGRDGFIGDRTNITVSDPCLAGPLIYRGAARFLRAQRAAEDQIVYFVPLAGKVTLNEKTAEPVHKNLFISSTQAVLKRWLEFGLAPSRKNWQWAGLAYQILRTQGPQQSVSVERGGFDLCWLTQLKTDAGESILGSWRRVLSRPPKHSPLELSLLEQTLIHRMTNNWEAHLMDIAQQKNGAKLQDLYGLDEIRSVTKHLRDAPGSALSEIMDREHGPLLYARALNLLGQSFKNNRLDHCGALMSVREMEQLIDSLGKIAEDCEVMSAKSQFIIVPAKEDLQQSVLDAERHGARCIARLIVSLSAHRYLRRELRSKKSSSSAASRVFPRKETHNV